jgi:hypothetical protein
MRRSLRRGGLFAVSAAVVLAAAGAAHAGVTDYRTIALTGTDGVFGPGLGAGVTFATIGQHQPSINYAGQVAFRGISSTNTSQGLWLHSPMSGNANLAVGGGAQPGGGTFPTGTSIINSPTLNNAGNVGFRLGAQTGLFADVGSGMSRVALGGDAAPSAGGALYGTSAVATGMPLFNQGGQVGYVGLMAVSSTSTPPVVTTAGIANAQAVFVTPVGGGAANMVVRQNDNLLGLDATGNTRVGLFNALTMSMNNAGYVALTANLQGSNVVTGTGATGNSAALLSTRSGSLGVVARIGNAAPDATGNPSATDLYRTFGSSNVAFNDVGSVAFSATLRNAAGTQTSTGAFYTDTGGVLRQIARQGEALPSITGAAAGEFTGVNWGVSYNNPVLNAQGTLAFQASGLGGAVTSSNAGALLTMSSTGVFSKIARHGDVAIAGGAPDLTDVRFLSIGDIALNAAGTIAFSSTLTGNGVSVGLGNGSGLFAFDSVLGQISLVARTGDLFEVAPGDLRTIATIGGIITSGGENGRVRSLSDSNQLVFELDFTNGTSGVFAAYVPAPGAVGVLALGGLMAARRRRA